MVSGDAAPAKGGPEELIVPLVVHLFILEKYLIGYFYLMERRKPHFKLELVKQALGEQRYRFTRAALERGS